MLWTSPADRLRAALRAGRSAGRGRRRSSSTAAASQLLHDEVLLNLRPEWPPFFSRFQRLIEIVSLDDEDRAAARERYRFYRDRGYEIRTHDLSKTSA